MSKKTFLVYPCGKKFEVNVPIQTTEVGVVLPGQEQYFKYAKEKFQIGNLKVVEEEVADTQQKQSSDFISLSHKVRSIE